MKILVVVPSSRESVQCTTELTLLVNVGFEPKIRHSKLDDISDVLLRLKPYTIADSLRQFQNFAEKIATEYF